MSKKKFEILTNGNQLDLMRVVDHLVCGYQPQNSSDASSNIIGLEQILGVSFTLAARCTNYGYPGQEHVEQDIVEDVRDLADLSTSVGANSILIPMSRFDAVNQAFARAVTKVNEQSGRKVAVLATEPYAPLLQYRPHYNGKKLSSMLSEDRRGVWFFAEPVAAIA